LIYISNDGNLWANLSNPSKEKSWGMEWGMLRKFW
jgi:hypothetical protein